MYLVAILLLIVSQCVCQSYEDVDRLVVQLTNTSTYKSYIRPSRDQSKPTFVNISMGLYWLNSFDLSNGKMVLTGYIVLKWIDQFLTWDPTQHAGLTKVFLPNDVYWKPKLYNVRSDSSVTDNRMASAVVYYSGLVVYVTGGSFDSPCDTDIYNMPYDSHVCTLSIMPIGQDSKELVFKHAEILNDQFMENQEWHCEDLTTDILNFSAANVEINFVRLSFKLRRRPAHMVMHILLPYILTVGLNLVACFVSVDSGERVTFSLTLFLSFIFVVADISGDLPSDSKDIALFSILGTIIHFLNTLGVVWSVVVTNIASRPEVTPVPCWFRKTVTCWKTLRFKQKNGTRDQTMVREMTHEEIQSNVPVKMEAWVSNKHLINNGKTSINDALRPTDIGSSSIRNGAASEESQTMSWKEVANILDRIFFTFVLVCLTVSGLTYMIQVSRY